tara:strand:+ start:159 stop:1076 length:918 start_codon:yes stop_codon:yes gene_type:complete
LRKILSFCVATLCLYFAFKQVNLEDINRAISNSNFYYILIALLTTYITFILRSIRWKILLDSPSNLKLNKYISTTHIGYFLNNILPFRAGDLGRAKLLSNHSNQIRFSFLLGSLVAEKIIDLWMIGFFSIYLIFFGFNDVLGLTFSLGILLLYIITSLIIFGNNSVINKIKNQFSITKNFVDGYLLISKNKLKLGIVSLLLWCSFVVYMVALLKSINIHLSFEQYIGITIITGIVTSLPIAPAAIGTYHLAVIYFLSLYGIGVEQSQTAAILLHSIFLLYTIILGYIYLSFEKVELKSLIDDNKN